MMRRILYIHSSSCAVNLAEACLSLTPKVSCYPTNELFLEIAGTQKLLGGEEGILLKLEELLSSFGVPKRIVLTDRAEWARALCTSSEVILPPGKSETPFFALPIERLQHCGDPTLVESEKSERIALIAFMKRVGLRWIYDFARLPLIAVSRRFGKLGISLSEWVLGRREVILPVFVPSHSIQEAIDAEDLPSLDALLFALRQSLVRIEERLRGRAHMAQELKLTFLLESQKKLVRHLKFSEPQHTASGMLSLLREFLSTLHWDAPLRWLEIEVSDTSPYTPAQLFLLEGAESRFQDLSQFVMKLQARYGNQAVGSPALQESYLPEKSWSLQNVSAKRCLDTFCPNGQKVSRHLFTERPLLLYTPPKVFDPPRSWRMLPSENLDCEWWEDSGKRQYFVVESPQNEKLWVFRDQRSGQWFLHGLFD